MRRSMVYLTAVVSLAATACLGPGAASATVPSPAVAHRNLRATAHVASHGVTLVTGDSVRVVKNALGSTIVEGVPSARTASGFAFQTVTTAKQTYVIPADARPYLGTVLDPALFDVTALAGAGATARIPVRVSFTGTKSPSVPGVTVTSAGRGSLSGYLTPSSARQFGAALARQYRTDAKANFPSHRTLFGATRIASADAAPPVATPDYPMRTLIIKAVNDSGAPEKFAFLTVYDTNNFGKFLGFAEIVDGQARLSVPLGTYGMDAGFDKSGTAGPDTGFAVVTKSDYVVSGQDQVVTLDERTATSRLSVRTPKPADQQTEEFDVLRTDGTGEGTLDDGYAVGPGAAIYVAPAGQTTSGTLTSAASWDLTGTPVSGDGYTYALDFPSARGIPADQSYRIPADDLATFRSRYYVDGPAREGILFVTPILPGSGGGTAFGIPVSLPSTNDTYINTIPGAVYFTSLTASPDPDNPFAATIDDAPRLAPAGTTFTSDWARGPALPQVPVETNGYPASFGFDCPSCRTANKLQIGLDFADDTTPGHSWELDGPANGKPVAHLSVYRDGKKVSDQPDTGLASIPVPAGSARYRVLDEVDRRPSLALQSVRTTTDITFVSAAGQGGALPSTWTCSLGKGCTVLPMLRAAVALPVNLVGSVPLGTSSIGLTLAHIQGAPRTPITSGTVSVREPGGPWVALPTEKLGDGSYSATLKTTSAEAGTDLDLRVTGADSAGGRIVQTAISAFAVSSS